MRIAITASAFSIAPRRTGSILVLYIGPAAVNEPWIELIADHVSADVRVVFHAVMLRPSTITALGHVGAAFNPQYTRQRS